MRIGVVPVSSRITGGVYQYSTTLAKGLSDLHLPDSMIMFTEEGEELAPELAAIPFEHVEISSTRGVLAPLKRALSAVVPTPMKVAVRNLANRAAPVKPDESMPSDLGTVVSTPRGRLWAKGLGGRGLDLMLYPTSNAISFEVGIPYIVAIHDLQHRLQPKFPEVSANGEWEAREYDLGNCITSATIVLVDSEVGKEDVLRFYGDRGIAEDEVMVLPFLPAPYISDASDLEVRRVLAAYGLERGYLFYPAQFWPHKNHVRIVEALALLRGQGLDVRLVLSGSHSGELREATFVAVKHKAAETGVGDLVRYLGRVPDEDMSALYLGSAGLIMPTFFGPTNIPPLEAFSLGRPVITSDIRGIREQMDGAALLIDPRSAESISAGIRRLLTEPGLADVLVTRGRERLTSFSRSDYLERLRSIIETARTRVARA